MQRYRIIRYRTFVSAFVLLNLAFLLFSGGLQATAQNNPPQAAVPWQRVAQILVARSFVSGDELFQLLNILYNEDKKGAFRLDRDLLEVLKKKITTLFPLAACEAIEMENGRLTFRFTEDQQIAIPNTWLQASLRISDSLVLRIEDDRPGPDLVTGRGIAPDPDDRASRFVVQEGSLQLHFSFLLKLFGSKMRDAGGSELLYRINNRKKISSLYLVEKIPLSEDHLKISSLPHNGGHRAMQWIDIHHPDFSGTRDIGIGETNITLLGTEIELLSEQMIRIGKGGPRKNKKAWDWFSDALKSFRDYVHTGHLGTRINYTRNFGYHFEEKKIVMTMGFSGFDAPKKPDRRREKNLQN